MRRTESINPRTGNLTIRISLSVFNTEEDIDALIEGLRTVDPEVLKSIDNSILRGNC